MSANRADHSVSHIVAGERWRFLAYALLMTLLSPLLFYRAARRRRAMRASAHPRVLVVPIMTRVGDLVCATVTFRALKEQFPDAHLAVLVADKARGIVERHPRIDTLISVNDPLYKGFAGRGRLFRRIYAERFDAVVCLAPNPFGNLVALASGAPLRIKTTTLERTLAERATDWMQTELVPFVAGSSILAHYLALLAPLGVVDAIALKELVVSPEARERARAFLATHGVSGPVAGITVSTGNVIKQWPLERFAAVADLVIERYGMSVLFLDSPANASRVDAVRRLMRHADHTIAVTDAPLADLPAYVAACALLVAGDTGAIHIAHALGVPLVDIVGPVHPDEQVPAGNCALPVLPPADIRPSVFAFAPPGPRAEQERALEQTTVDHIAAALAALRTRGCF